MAYMILPSGDSSLRPTTCLIDYRGSSCPRLPKEDSQSSSSKAAMAGGLARKNAEGRRPPHSRDNMAQGIGGNRMIAEEDLKCAPGIVSRAASVYATARGMTPSLPTHPRRFGAASVPPSRHGCSTAFHVSGFGVTLHLMTWSVESAPSSGPLPDARLPTCRSSLPTHHLTPS